MPAPIAVPKKSDLSETIKQLEWKIGSLQTELAKVTRERDEALYKKEIAEWAVVGVVSSRIRFQMTHSPEGIVQVNDVLRLSELIGQQAAHALLRGAQLAFDAHTELYELRHHVHYLENRARARGVEFTPWVDTVATQGAFKYTRHAAWPFPKPFTNVRTEPEHTCVPRPSSRDERPEAQP